MLWSDNFFFREGQTYMYPNLVVLSQVTDDLSKHYIIVIHESERKLCILHHSFKPTSQFKCNILESA